MIFLLIFLGVALFIVSIITGITTYIACTDGWWMFVTKALPYAQTHHLFGQGMLDSKIILIISVVAGLIVFFGVIIDSIMKSN